MPADRLPLLALACVAGVACWLPATINAQSPPPIEWQKCLGGSGSDGATAVQPTSDGGYVVAGVTDSDDGDVTGLHGSTDFWIVKLDASGALQWQRALGGTSDEIAQQVVQTSDGGYAVAGTTWSNDGDVSGNHGQNDYWVVKLDPDGDIEWQRTLGGSEQDGAYSMRQTPDGGFVVAGYTFSNDGDVSGNHGNSDLWVVKLDALGDLQWQHALGGSALEGNGAVIPASDGGYLVGGAAGSEDGDVSGNHGENDLWLVKLDPAGSIVWQNCFGGSSNDWCYSVLETNDGGYVAAGDTYSNDGDVSGNHGERDVWVVRIDGSGDLQWQATLGCAISDNAAWAVEDSDGGSLVLGSTRENSGNVSGNHGQDDFWLVKLDPLGALLWQTCLGGTGVDLGDRIATTLDGGFVLTGESFSNNGDVSGNNGGSDVWLVKLLGDNVGLHVPSGTPTAFTIVPDPGTGGMLIQYTTPVFDARVTVCDAIGRKVLDRRMTGGTRTLGTGDLPGGLYVVMARSVEGTCTRTLVLE